MEGTGVFKYPDGRVYKGSSTAPGSETALSMWPGRCGTFAWYLLGGLKGLSGSLVLLESTRGQAPSEKGSRILPSHIASCFKPRTRLAN